MRPFEVDDVSTTVTFSSLVVTGRNSSNFGGAINVGTRATANIVGTTIQGNFSDKFGGGVYVSNGYLNIFGTTIIGNKAREAGGGVFSVDPVGGAAYHDCEFQHLVQCCFSRRWRPAERGWPC